MTSAAATATQSYTAIDVGSTSANANWIADADYTGGTIGRVASSTINISAASNPAPESVYQTQRYGKDFTYSISNLYPNGAYTVRLHFAETFFYAPGKRVFSATINGTQVLTNLDIFRAAGGSNIALVKQFSSTANSSGEITIRLSASVNNASIAGIEAVSTETATPSPSPKQIPTMHGVVTSMLSSWDSWTGKSAKFVGIYNDSQASTWSALNDVDWLLTTYPAGTPMIWSLATYPTSSSLAAVTAGAGNNHYATWAAEILNAAPAPDGNYYIRPNWEVPGNWFTWGAQSAASPANCIAAFQQIAKVFHAASPKFKMVWDTFPVYGDNIDHSIYYPGNSYVDVVSQDVYPDTTNGHTAASAWNYDLVTPNGLNWLSSFASAHGKRIAISEWGIDTDSAGPIVTNFHNWFAANNVLYDAYFDEGSERLSNNQFPTAGAVYRSYL